MKNIHGLLLIGCSALALAGCGPSEIASPGTGGDVIINNPPAPAPSPSPTPTPGGGGTVTPADACPDVTGLTDAGTIAGPTGEYRVCTLPAQISSSTTLPYIQGVLYAMDGRVDVGTDGGAAPSGNDSDVTLTIEPGVIVFAATGRSFLMVNRGNQIQAAGTADRPIIFTSRQNVEGTATDSSDGQWGGLILAGRAPITDCREPNATPGTVDCERQVEGEDQPALYGGATDNDSSGTLRYVQIRYSGFTLAPDSELQSLTTGGTGTGTEFDYIMSYNSSDDGMEFFGGHVNMKHAIVVGASDDSFDSDTGVKANIQYAIAVQRPGVGNSIIEADSSNDLHDQTPRQDTRISNATFVHQNPDNSDNAAIYLRGGTDYWLANTVLVAQNESCLRIRNPETLQQNGPDEQGPVRFDSVVMQCGSPVYIGSDGVTEAEAEAAFNAGTNNDDAFTNTLSSLFINGSNESGVPAFNPTGMSSFFDSVDFIGAARSGDTWYQSWTCDSGTVTFGSGNACTSLPVY